jgi:hypothetical protein
MWSVGSAPSKRHEFPFVPLHIAPIVSLSGGHNRCGLFRCLWSYTSANGLNGSWFLNSKIDNDLSIISRLWGNQDRHGHCVTSLPSRVPPHSHCPQGRPYAPFRSLCRWVPQRLQTIGDFDRPTDHWPPRMSARSVRSRVRSKSSRSFRIYRSRRAH